MLIPDKIADYMKRKLVISKNTSETSPLLLRNIIS